MTIQAVLFDAYGTLFDIYAVRDLADQLYPGKGVAIAAAWRDKQVEYTRLVTQADPNTAGGSRFYLPFHDVTQRALIYVLDALGLDRSAGQSDALMERYAHPTLFPEVRDVMQRLRSGGMKTAILSNGDPDMLRLALESTGLASMMDDVISADDVRLYKIAPEVYALGPQRLGVDKGATLFVSSNAWDIVGATWFGFVTHWVNRQGAPFETLPPAPAHSSADLTGVLDSVGRAC